MGEYSIRTVSASQWALFVWQRDECERIQGKACVGCGLAEDCIKLYQHVSNICLSNKCAPDNEYANHQPSKGNACVELHGNGLGRVIRRANRDVRLSEGIGI
jgi:hypothetical protein